MKNLILAFTILMSNFYFCCSCLEPSNIFNIYSSSDLVAEIVVENIRLHENKKLQNSRYLIDVKYNTVYKGKMIKTFSVYGVTEIDGKRSGIGTSCSLSLTKGEKFILFYNQEEDKHEIHFCTPKIRSKYSSNFVEAKKVLRSLSKLKVPTNSKNYILDLKLDPETNNTIFTKFDGLKAENSFALLQITLNSDGTFKDVQYLAKLQSNKDDDIINTIKQTKIQTNRIQSTFNDNETFILPIHYYKGDKKSKSMISLYFH